MAKLSLDVGNRQRFQNYYKPLNFLSQILLQRTIRYMYL